MIQKIDDTVNYDISKNDGDFAQNPTKSLSKVIKSSDFLPCVGPS